MFTLPYSFLFSRQEGTLFTMDSHKIQDGCINTNTMLSIETSTNVLSIAVHHQGECIVAYTKPSLLNGHYAELFFPMIDALFTMKKIDWNSIQYIGACVGPGSFTGLRMGIAAMDMMRISLPHIQVIPFNLFEVMSHPLKNGNHTNTMIMIQGPKGDRGGQDYFSQGFNQKLGLVDQPIMRSKIECESLGYNLISMDQFNQYPMAVWMIYKMMDHDNLKSGPLTPLYIHDPIFKKIGQ
jgi:tRNA threonylcarbamoyladenosine biosynthesis protein TsaB